MIIFYDFIKPRIPSTSSLSYDLVHAEVGTSKENGFFTLAGG